MITNEEAERIANTVIMRMQDKYPQVFRHATQPLTIKTAVFMALEEAAEIKLASKKEVTTA